MKRKSKRKRFSFDGLQKQNITYFFLVLLLSSILILGLTLLGISIDLEKNSLVLGIWGEYIKIDLIKEFEKKYNTNITIINYNSNENLFQKLQQTTIDLFVPSDYFLSYLIEKNWVELIDFSRLSFKKSSYLTKINNEIEKSVGNKTILNYGVPYFWGFNSLVFKNNIVYDEVKKIVGEEKIIDMSFMFDSRIYKNYKIGIVDDRSFLIPLGLKKLGLSYIEPKSLYEAKRALNAILQYTKEWIITDDVDIYDKLLSNQIDIAFSYSGWTNLMLLGEKSEIKNVFLDKTFLWVDLMAINNFSKKKDICYKFINFIFNKQNQVRNMEEIGDFSAIDSAYNLAVEENLISRKINLIDKAYSYPLIEPFEFEEIKRIYDEFRAK